MEKLKCIENVATSFICYCHDDELEFLPVLYKPALPICLVKSGNESTIQLTPLSFLSCSHHLEEKKCVCSIGDLFNSKPILLFFLFAFPSPIICYGFSVMKIFGSSLRRSLNINVSLKIEMMPQLVGENLQTHWNPLLLIK